VSFPFSSILFPWSRNLCQEAVTSKCFLPSQLRLQAPPVPWLKETCSYSDLMGPPLLILSASTTNCYTLRWLLRVLIHICRVCSNSCDDCDLNLLQVKRLIKCNALVCENTAHCISLASVASSDLCPGMCLDVAELESVSHTG
jgi:hypothetical protein